jgi:hypothetical protein
VTAWKSLFQRKVDLQNGHDWVDVSAEHGYGDLISMQFMGRDSASVTIRLIEPDEVRNLARALLEAADALDPPDHTPVPVYKQTDD